MTTSSASQKGEFLALLGSVDVVTFDVFDTLLLRGVPHPSDLFALVQSKGSSSAPYIGFDFAGLRVQAEDIAREKNRILGVCPDATSFDQIYQELGMLADLSEQAWRRLQELEFETERSMARASSACLGYVEAARAAGKEVAYLSDQYLPNEQVLLLLDSAGVPRPDFLSVSSCGLCKSDGSVFRHILHARGWDPRRWLHVGDHPWSDVERPAMFGIKCLRTPKLVDAHAGWLESERLWRKAHAGSSGIADSLLLDGLRVLEAENHPDVWERAGFEVAGPLMAGFAAWLHRQASADEVEHLYFLARDGLILQQVYNALYGASAVPNSYLYASRRLFNVASIRELTEADVDFLASYSKGSTVGAVLKRCGLNPPSHLADAQKRGYRSLEDKVNTDREPALRGLIFDLRDPLAQVAASEREVLLEYLEAEGVLAGNLLGIVDIGWHGSMQESLASVAGIPTSKLVGYYLGLHDLAQERRERGWQLKAFLDESSLKLGDIYRTTIRQSVPLVELFLTQPSGTIVALKKAVRGVEPVCEEDGASLELAAELASLHRGIHRFVTELKSGGSKELGFAAAVAPLARLVNDPTTEEAAAFGNVYHHEGFAGIGGGGLIGAPSKGASGEALQRELEQSHWKQGFLKNWNR